LSADASATLLIERGHVEFDGNAVRFFQDRRHVAEGLGHEVQRLAERLAENAANPLRGIVCRGIVCRGIAVAGTGRLDNGGEGIIMPFRRYRRARGEGENECAKNRPQRLAHACLLRARLPIALRLERNRRQGRFRTPIWQVRGQCRGAPSPLSKK
jgi:hypothetical protein